MERTDRFLLFISISILIHILLFFLFRQMDLVYRPVTAEEELKKIRIKFNQGKMKQVVKTDQPESNIPPEKAEFMSEKNTRVEQEMRAVHTGPFQNYPGSELGNTPSGRQSKKQKNKEGIGQNKQIPQLRELLQGLGGARSQTYDDIDRPTGDQTLLNTNEYIYASFFNRIKEKVGPIWETRVVDILRQMKGHLSSKDYLTVLWVTINREGRILDIDVQTSATYREFDHAAKESFWEAHPFPNPPSGLFKGKLVAGFDFAFHVELGSSGAVQFHTVPPNFFLPPGESNLPYIPPTRP